MRVRVEFEIETSDYNGAEFKKIERLIKEISGEAQKKSKMRGAGNQTPTCQATDNDGFLIRRK